MKVQIAILLGWLAFVAAAGADQTIETLQQALKDQGFYYGEINGEKNADTVAAIRRYQIRNGLQVTGDLNDETLRSIKSNAATAHQSPTNSAPPVAQGSSNNSYDSDLRDDSSRQNGNSTPVQPYVPARPEGAAPNTGQIVPSGTGLFAGTPYETAPLQVQRKVITDAERVLARHGLFRGEIDGAYGPDLEFSLRAYQARVGLPRSGRLDLETLAALELLPGARAPVFTPRRPVGLPPPPVRGEWVRP
jgi:peptidoglycan hydrolase-like protein with peptidoglycan-binding domain